MFYIDQKLTIYSGDDLVGYLLPSDGLKEAKVDSNLNSISELVFTLPFDSPKWSLLEDPDLRIQVDGREFRPLNPIEQETTGSLIGKVTLSESQCMLGRRFPTVGSVPYEVTILASDSGEGGFEAGSAGSAIHRILTAGGTTPTSPTFTRASTAYNPETGAEVAVNEPRFVEGAFEGSQALYVEEGTANIVPNPSFESGLWPETWNGDNGTASLVTGWNGQGNAMRIAETLSGSFGKTSSRTIAMAASTTYTLSYRARASADGVMANYCYIMDSTVGNMRLADKTLTAEWQRYEITFTNGATPRTTSGVLLAMINQAGSWIEFDDVQLEQKPYATSFHPGTRSPELPTIPTAGVLSPSEGTWEQRVYIGEHQRRLGLNYVFYLPRSGAAQEAITIRHHDATQSWQMVTRNDAGAASSGTTPDNHTPDGWHVFRVTWCAAKAELRIDGVSRITLLTPNLPSAFGANASVGYRDGVGGYLNSRHADIRLSSIARTDDSDLISYQSNEPLPVDEHTTYKLNFDGSLTPEKIGLFGWSVGTVDVSGSHDLETEKKSVLENLHEVQKIWGGWLVFDSVMKTVSLRDDVLWINDTGYEIRYKKNEKSLKKIKDWNGVVTRLIPLGEKDLSISSVNDGSPYIENFSFTTEIRESFWRREDIYNPTTLKTEATAYLAKVCKPKVQYKSEILDLRTLPAYSHESLSLGDIVTIQDEDLAVDETVRVIGLSYDVIQPWKCSLVLGDPLPSPYDPIGVVDLKKEFNGRSVGGLPLNAVPRTSSTFVVADRSTSRDFRRADYVVPSGSLNAQVVIQEAIDDLPATGGKVVLLDGTYKTRAPIEIPSHCTLEGQGSSTVIETDLCDGIVNKNAMDTDLVIRNMRLKGNGTANYDCILLTEVSDSTIYGLWVEDFNYGIRMEDCTGVTVQANVFRDLLSSSVNSEGTFSGIKVIDNTITNSGGVRLFSQGAISENNHVIGNVIRDFGSIYLYYTSRNTVASNTISRSSGNGITLENTSHSKIEGNTLTDCGLHMDLIYNQIFLGASCDYNSVVENTVRMVNSVVHSGTAVSGTSNTIKLSAEASTTNDDYNNRRISITSGTGSGQDKKITDYVGSTQTATLDTNWATVPDATSVYEIYARPDHGIRIHSSTNNGNLVTNNDLHDSGVTGSLYDGGTGTITAAGNRL